MANITDLLGNIGTGLSIANGVGNLVDGLFGSDGVFGHSSWYKTLKNGEAQNQVNQQMAEWNMENVTKPVFQMENQEWQRRFGEQNTEWERQWNLQNKYNSPEEQLKRYMAIGGNPADFVQGGNGAAAPAATGEVGSPTVNEAASSFANPADLARLQSNEIERKAKNAYAFNMNMQAIKQSIDNITEADFRAGELETIGVNIKLGKAKEKLTIAQRTEILEKLPMWNAEVNRLNAQTQLFQQTVKESVEKTKLIYEQYKNAQKEGEILDIQKEWLPFEKWIETEQAKAMTKKALLEAGVAGKQIGYYAELIRTEIKKQSILGLQSEGQVLQNNILYNQWIKDVDYTNKVYPKILEMIGGKAEIDLSYYPKEKQWNLIGTMMDQTFGRGIQAIGAMNQTANTLINGYAAFATKGMSEAVPEITIGTPGYNTSPVYQGGTYNPYGQ